MAEFTAIIYTLIGQKSGYTFRKRQILHIFKLEYLHQFSVF